MDSEVIVIVARPAELWHAATHCEHGTGMSRISFGPFVANEPFAVPVPPLFGYVIASGVAMIPRIPPLKASAVGAKDPLVVL